MQMPVTWARQKSRDGHREGLREELRVGLPRWLYVRDFRTWCTREEETRSPVRTDGQDFRVWRSIRGGVGGRALEEEQGPGRASCEVDGRKETRK